MIPERMPVPHTGLDAFLPPVRAWFQARFGRPTPPQAQGWPAIQRGEHTLILAPTGSGKTLAAFLWGIDQLFHEQTDPQADETPGVRLVYISPLKALNNDIRRNLRQPLAGIRRQADEHGSSLPPLRVAVRSGDTPQRERQAMRRKPPHILITTPESFYLLLTSPKARDMFRTVHTIIVDEIHTLAGNKRGVHLALSLERLQRLAGQPVQRIGLSATIQPLDEVARFLGGSQWSETDGERTLQPRPVTIVDAAYEKALDLKIVSVVDDFNNLPGDSIWPSVIPQVLDLIRAHETTLVFANNRRLAERTADRLNEQIAAEAEGKTTGLIEGGVVKGVGMMGAGTGSTDGPIRVHHGSVSKEARLVIEQQLKAGDLPALVGTSSLELGIDIGTVDLVVQLQSSKSVAQGLQRVGRSGHLVGQTSKGRVFPTHHEDVIEAAAIAGGMLHGEVEPTHTPRQPLDVLAQQVVAMISVQTWDEDALFDLVRCASAYEGLTRRVFEVTLGMLAGRYPSQAYRELRARLSWDRVNHKLSPLPGSRLLALLNGGTIPNSGAFGAYLSDGKTKLGELDEEFVFETRIGDTFMLGSQVWRVIDLTDERMTVAEAPGAVPRMPFWRGDYPWRPYELGQRVGVFRRLVADRLIQLKHELSLSTFGEVVKLHDAPPVRAALDWLSANYALDARSARHLLSYVAVQLDQTGAIASDRTILIELFDDALGDPRLVIHSPFGGKVNGSWELALRGLLRDRLDIEVEVQTSDDGILFRLLEAGAADQPALLPDEFDPCELLTGLKPLEAREFILRELPNSAVFGTRFRQNAARALLLPGARGGKRTPFWLQRLRARDLLQVVRQFDDFPIVAETYRDCLQDVLDVPHLEQILTDLGQGQIQVMVVRSETPSAVAKSLLWRFTNTFMYEQDMPRAERHMQQLAVSRDLLQDVLQDVALDELLRPEAIDAVRGQLQHTAPTACVRTAEELAVLLQSVGDLSSAEIGQRTTIDPAGWIAHLGGEGRIIGMDIPIASGSQHRWVAVEYASEYAAAFGDAPPEQQDEARRTILARFLGHTGPVSAAAIRARYAFPEAWLDAELARLVSDRELVHGRFTPRLEDGAGEAEFVDRRTLEQIHRRTLGILRREVQPVSMTVYADFLAHWQHLVPGERLAGEGALMQVLQQLCAYPVVGQVWERDVLPLRLDRYRPSALDALCSSGQVFWVGAGGADLRRGRLRLLFRGEGHAVLEPPPDDLSDFSETARAVYAFLTTEGVALVEDMCAALDLEQAAVMAALLELAMTGLVTGDGVAAARVLVERGAPTQARKPLSALETQLAERRTQLGLGSSAPSQVQRAVRRPRSSRYKAAKRRVRERLARQVPVIQQVAEPEAHAPSAGRWMPVHRFAVMGKALSPSECAARQARLLLSRYGVVSHECLSDETGAWDWRGMVDYFQRLEMRGELRRGYFIRGLPGIQYALPEVVERLRALRDAPESESVLVVMNACDPANLYGPLLESIRRQGADEAQTLGLITGAGEPLSFSRLPSTWLVQHRGLPVLVAANTCAHLTTLQGADEGLVLRALRALLDHLARFSRRLDVETWNHEPIIGSPGQPLLESLGFYRVYPAMVWQRPV